MDEPLHDTHLIRALRALASEVTHRNRAVAHHLGINPSDLAVLDLLHQEGPQTPTTLARRAHMSTTTITSILRRLERDGWVERRPDNTDLRSFTIHATGVDRLAHAYQPINEQLTALVADWDDHDKQQLLDFLSSTTTIIRNTPITST